ncbi:MAG: hypothetical protein WDM80_10195 [Limisphaerales bacterium]
MKTIYKICTISGFAAILATTSLHASFDESMYGGQATTGRILADDNTSSGYYETVTSRHVISPPSGSGFATPNGGISALVPEPTTIIAGALLLLPVGVSTIRILRQRSMK